MNTKDKLLESIDIECFLEHYAPGEWERFGDAGRAFDFFTEYMTPQELKKELDESGCRNEELEQATQFEAWAAAIDADQEYIDNEVSK